MLPSLQVDSESMQKSISVLEDFKSTLPKYGLKLLFGKLENGSYTFYFKIHDTTYHINPFRKEYYTTRFGSKEKSKNYLFKDCTNLLIQSKLFFWQFRGIKVLPDVDVTPQLRKIKAKNVKNTERAKKYRSFKNRPATNPEYLTCF